MLHLDEINARILLKAARHGQIDILQGLLGEGANVNSIDCGGNTALMWAAWYGHIDTVKLLLDNGADVNIKNNDGDTVLSLVEEEELVNLLKKHEATA